ncbi:hypothetical protein [Chondrinema litorale]|uniref:hypothetical protein n=1 Tax=Chondrinema litorale TaxID=2994555 RepID=UPI002543506B|nr:hypothetical protein [Chondrinema litorale]UZS00007.1 hypothetical protein OQ292_39180 [Chondrinema litorale]
MKIYCGSETVIDAISIENIDNFNENKYIYIIEHEYYIHLNEEENVYLVKNLEEYLLVKTSIINKIKINAKQLLDECKSGEFYPIPTWVTSTKTRKQFLFDFEIPRILRLLKIEKQNIEFNLLSLKIIEKELSKFCTNTLLIKDTYIFLTAYIIEVINYECDYEYITVNQTFDGDVIYFENKKNEKSKKAINFSHTFLIMVILNTGFISEKFSEIAQGRIDDHFGINKYFNKINHDHDENLPF